MSEIRFPFIKLEANGGGNYTYWIIAHDLDSSLDSIETMRKELNEDFAQDIPLRFISFHWIATKRDGEEYAALRVDPTDAPDTLRPKREGLYPPTHYSNLKEKR